MATAFFTRKNKSAHLPYCKNLVINNTIQVKETYDFEPYYMCDVCDFKQETGVSDGSGIKMLRIQKRIRKEMERGAW